MQPDEMVDQLGAVLGKYEVPMGLMNKRKLSISVDREIMDGWILGVAKIQRFLPLIIFPHNYIVF
jgi:hypothetical protein